MGGYEECEDSSHSSYPSDFFSIFGFGPMRLAFKRKEGMKKLVFSSFEKPAPGEERCCMESPLTF